MHHEYTQWHENSWNSGGQRGGYQTLGGEDGYSMWEGVPSPLRERSGTDLAPPKKYDISLEMKCFGETKWNELYVTYRHHS